MYLCKRGLIPCDWLDHRNGYCTALNMITDTTRGFRGLNLREVTHWWSRASDEVLL